MPLRLDVKRKLLARSDRVKCVDLHPTEPWAVASLYNGNVHIWNYESQQLVKSFEVCDLPVRTAKFVPRKNWVITGSDDMFVRVFNYNTLERVHQFEAHGDYLRAVTAHPTQPYLLTSSDDMSIKLWDWDNKWTCKQVFEGHMHYVMQVVINPKDNNTFATASLDRTIKVWQLGSNVPNFTLEGHEKGVNCVDYYHGGDKPYIISGADDRLVKIWDYQNKTCVATLDGHAQNISAVCFHPELPIVITGSEDSTVRIWHVNTYRLETTLNYGLERVWAISALRGSNAVAIGYDEGSVVIKLGREKPAVSMDFSGKIVWARHSEIQQANLKTLGSEAQVKDGERLPLSVKDMGACEIYPQSVSHNPNGRFVAVCGDGEYIIYTAMALRNKAYGSAQEFVWANDSAVYAVKESGSVIKVFKNFKEIKSLKPDYGVEGIYGGNMLGVRDSSGLSFYEWEGLKLIRRIEISPKTLFWNENGELLAIVSEDAVYVLRHQASAIAAAESDPSKISDDGIEDAFDVVSEVSDTVDTGLWVGDCFVYTTKHNRLNYYVGGEIVTIAHLDRIMYLLGYIAKENRLYLCDKDLNVVSYQLLVSVLEYQTAVMRQDFDNANRVLPSIPKEQRTRVAHFLEKQGFKQQALAVSTDPDHRFDLALNLGDLKVAYQLATEADSQEKWKALSIAATARSELILAGECLGRAQDYGGLLLLASSAGSGHLMNKLAVETTSKGENNVSFVSNFLMGRVDECLELLIRTDRLPEAAFFARTYVPSQISRVVTMWKEKVGVINQKSADSLADPTQYDNLFPKLNEALQAEQYLKQRNQKLIPAAAFTQILSNEERNVLEEVASGGLSELDTTMPALNQGITPPVMLGGVMGPPPDVTPVLEQQPVVIPKRKESPPPSKLQQPTPEPFSAEPDIEAEEQWDQAAQQLDEDEGLKQPSKKALDEDDEATWGDPGEDSSFDEGYAGTQKAFGLTDLEYEKYRQVFMHFDSDKSGFISKDEVAAVIKEIGGRPNDRWVKDLICEADSSGDGTIDWPEFLKAMTGRDPEPSLQAPDIATSSRAQPDLVPAGGSQPDVAANAPSAHTTNPPALIQDTQRGANSPGAGAAELELDLENLQLDDDANLEDMNFEDEEWNLDD